MKNLRHIQKKLILIKGAGEKASAVAHHLFSMGLKSLVMTELPSPTAERRGVSFSEAAYDGRKEVCGILCEKTPSSMEGVSSAWARGSIPLLIKPDDSLYNDLKPDIVIDAIMAKRNTGTTMEMAPLVVALGPGFCAGKDVHYVVETNPGSRALGNVIDEGYADSHTGVPTEISGLSHERLILSPAAGTLRALKDIGDSVKDMEIIGHVGEEPLRAPIPGLIWGLIRSPARVEAAQKIGDINPFNDRNICFQITPQALSIAKGVLEAILRASWD